MLQLAGPAAISAFRMPRLLTRLQAVVPDVAAASARFVHFVHPSQPLAERDREVLEHLLRYGAPAVEPETGHDLFVVPRLGTVSPWSSKATDIAQHCGLAVARVERGVRFRLTARQPLAEAELSQLLPLVHDRMTETCLFRPPRETELFKASAPRPVTVIDLESGGADALAQADKSLGLALSGDEIDYLAEQFAQLGRTPTAVNPYRL